MKVIITNLCCRNVHVRSSYEVDCGYAENLMDEGICVRKVLEMLQSDDRVFTTVV